MPVTKIDPASLPSLEHRWDAREITGLSNGDPVSTWEDSAGTSDVTQSGGARPTYQTNVQNGLPGVYFDGSDWLEGAVGGAANRSARTLIAVMRLEARPSKNMTVLAGFDSSSSRWSWSMSANASRNGEYSFWDSSNGWTDTTKVLDLDHTYIVAMEYEGGEDTLLCADMVDVHPGRESRGAIPTHTRWVVGTSQIGGANNEIEGWVHEILVFDEVLPRSTREGVEAWLADVWDPERADRYTYEPSGTPSSGKRTFGGDTLSEQPAGTTKKWSETDWTVISDASAIEGRAVECDTKSEWHGLAIDAAGTPTDVETIVHGWASSQTGGATLTGSAMRAGDGLLSARPNPGIWVQNRTSSPSGLQLRETVSGDYVMDVRYPPSVGTGNWYWIHTQLWGDVLRAKMWTGELGDAPAEWRAVVEVDTAAAGWVGAMAFSSVSGTQKFDYYAWGINGESPPTAATSITTTSLPNAQVGEPYSETLQATGGEEPYTWSIVSGSLPSGLSLTAATGEISGTPDTEETANFTVQVTDDESETDTQELSIEVEAAAPSGINRLTQASLRVLQAGGTGLHRLTQASLRLLQQDPQPPVQPVILEVGVTGTTIFASSSEMESPEEAAEHTASHWQVQVAGGDWSSPVFETEDTQDLVSVILESDNIPEETLVEIRVRYLDRWMYSPWSDAVEVMTDPAAPRPDQPSVLEPLDDIGFDYVEATSSAFSHEEGVGGPDQEPPDDEEGDDDEEWEELPWLAAVQWQIQHAGGDWSGSDLLVDTGLSSLMAEDLTQLFAPLPDGVDLEIRVRHQDGKYGTTSPWSLAVSFSTPEIPPVRPDKPVVTLVTCTRELAELQGSAFSHPEGSATHERTQWRVCGGEGDGMICQAETFDESPELLSISFPDIGGGHATRFGVRYEDQLGRWSEWSDFVVCEPNPEPPQPSFTNVVGGQVISDDLLIQWDVPESPEAPLDGWRWEVQMSSDDGETWSQLASGLEVMGYLFEIDGLPNGRYLIRVRTYYPDDITDFGEWAYLPLRIDRTGHMSVSYDFSKLDEIPATWQEVWDTTGDIEWRLVTANLGDFDPDAGKDAGLCDFSDDEGKQRPAGILGKNTRHFNQRWGVLAFTELGQPEEMDMTVEFAILNNDFNWFGHRFSNTRYLNGGAAWRATQDRGHDSGFQWRLQVGPQAFPVPPPTRECEADGTIWKHCDCGWANCTQCTEGIPARAWTARRRLDRSISYALPWDNASIRRWGRRHELGGWGGVDSLETVSGKRHGALLSRRVGITDCCKFGGACCWSFVRYTMRVQIEKLESGTYVQRVQVLGPGLDPGQGWQQEYFAGEHFLGGHVDDMPCGYCGLAIYQLFDSFTNDPGVLFFSATVSDMTYDDDCEDCPCPESLIEATNFGQEDS